MENQSIKYAIILAAGKGRRMRATVRNKVTYEVGGRPMVLRTLDNLLKAGIKNVIAVVGFAKQSVMEVLGDRVTYVEQQKRLGTGHAVKLALRKIPQNADVVLVMNGDDSFFYTPEIIQEIINLYDQIKPSICFLTLEIANPTGLGRIVRDLNGKVLEIIEEKDATEAQKQITEVNPACYLFNVKFLRKYINKIPKSEATGEYYLTHLVTQAVHDNMAIETLKIKDIKWRGVNTPDELRQADELVVS